MAKSNHAAVESQTPKFTPYIAPETRMREMTVRGVLVGTLLGLVFGASSLYLVLKVGLTVSASIPVAVISITLFRLASKTFGIKDATILENNIVQTAGSAGESIAFGLGVTMPAIMILGFELEIWRVALVAVLGGLLGILMMIPLRRALIVAQHGVLKYPEGTACAEVLKAGASEESRAMASDEAKAEAKAAHLAGLASGTSARTIFTGFGIGLLYKTMNVAFKLWKDTPEKLLSAPLKGGLCGCRRGRDPQGQTGDDATCPIHAHVTPPIPGVASSSRRVGAVTLKCEVFDGVDGPNVYGMSIWSRSDRQ
jgi:uncharacterized oligopeptide transporter (OPT) family protein